MNPIEFVVESADAAFASDENCRVVAWNAGAEQLLGYSTSEVLGRACFSFVCGTDTFGNRFCDRACPLLNMVRRGERVRDFQVDMRTAHGRELRVSVSVMTFREPGSSQFSIVHVLREVAYAQALETLTQKLDTARDVASLLDLAAETIHELLQCQSVVIFSRCGYGRRFCTAAKVGAPSLDEDWLHLAPDNVLFHEKDGDWFTARDCLLPVARVGIDTADSPAIVPIRVDNDLFGFVVLGEKPSNGDYSQQDREFVDETLKRLSHALSNMSAGLNRYELQEAWAIQRAMLPRDLPSPEGYQIAGFCKPARVVSGDYYDVYEASKDTFAICIADVVGKGVPAALLMFDLQATVRLASAVSSSAQELCERVNRVFCANTETGKQITLFYGLLHAPERRFTYVNAGHLPLRILRADGTSTSLDTGGAALGLFPWWTYGQAELSLSPGDLIALYTDGVTKVRNLQGMEFGERRLLKALSENRGRLTARRLGAETIESVSQFCEGDFRDDATLLLVQVE